MEIDASSVVDARRRALLSGAASLVALGVAGISPFAQPARAAGTAPATAPDAANAPRDGRRILILGDSLSAEYGLRRGAGWVALLAARLKAQQRPYAVINASISGETTAGGRTRIADLLARHRPAVVVVELGGNDALRGLDLAATERNLGEMTRMARTSGAKPLLVGMRLPPNYGRAYTERFADLYTQVARRERAALVPFLLDEVGERPELFQADRIHPNESAQPRMLDNVWPVLSKLL